MTEEAQRIAIGKIIGREPRDYYCSICRECVPLDSVTSGGYHKKDGGKVEYGLPNWPTDLNAAIGLSESMSDDGWSYDIGRVGRKRWRISTFRGARHLCIESPMLSAATCESFLRAHERWVE